MAAATVIENTNYEETMVSIVFEFAKRISNKWVRFLPKQQYKWQRKIFVSAAACGCSVDSYNYYVTEDSCGNKLPAAVWMSGLRVIEEKKTWLHPKLSYWEEKRGDAKQLHTPPHMRKRNTVWIDKDGHTKTGV